MLRKMEDGMLLGIMLGLMTFFGGFVYVIILSIEIVFWILNMMADFLRMITG
jgi:hypothetical protein